MQQHPALIQAARNRLAPLDARRGGLPDDYHRRVREVIVIASSPRGGSSVTAELLRRRCSGFMQPRGESIPYLTLAGLRYPRTATGSDRLGDDVPSHAVAEVRSALGRDLGFRIHTLEAELLDRFVLDLTWRLSTQWPNESIDVAEVEDQVAATFAELQVADGWDHGEFRDAQRFHGVFLRRLQRDHPVVEPLYYDWTLAALERYLGHRPRPHGPPSAELIEMPPFLLTWPQRPADIDDVAARPLILKTSSDAYRLDFVQRLFPDAELRVLHLVRDPAACVNGLYDGWQHRGFFAVQVRGRELAISGYSDRMPAWARSWWKFDLPPGWEQVADRRLEEVCGFQWAAAHESILVYLSTTSADHLRVRFEDLELALAGGPVPGELAAWLTRGRPERVRPGGEPLEPVMVTAKPDPNRWRERRTIIEPVLATSLVHDVAGVLGYVGTRSR